MTQSTTENRRLILNERPKGFPNENTLRLENSEIPTPGENEMLLRTAFLSLDPYMRGRMSDAPSYAPPVEVGEHMVGGTVSQVVTSNLEGYSEGDWVLSMNGWQDYALSDGTGNINMGKSPQNPSWALGVLGMPGFTAYAGLLKIGTPKSGETLVVSSAAGAVGSIVGQIGKILGLRVVGIAGGPEKCKHVQEEYGFDLCIDYKADDFAERLAHAVPNGIDIYYENVGGAVFDAVLPLLNPNARIPVCGLISMYNATSLPDGPDRMGLLMSNILRKKLKMQGFIIFDDFPDLYPEFAEAMMGWLSEGKIQYKEDLIDGLENAPEAFVGLLKGENNGKRVIRVG
ncbi:NADP-dependent oxidoreductase [Falsihalocynthiibacter sp. SS001]|uniref:NADP-dependent oxidoreductase n=1 Tax=Falsihalocynthiibacter sp. SS001 TaxID=3349698 RepID=UPI0036D3E554